MKAIFFVAILALAVAQFNLPDVADLGKKVVKEIVKAEKEVQHLTKEEVQIVQEAVIEEYEYLTGKQPEQEKKPQIKRVEDKKPEENVPEKSLEAQPFILIGGAPADLNQNNNIEQAMEEKLQLAAETQEKAEVQTESSEVQIMFLPAASEVQEKNMEEYDVKRPQEEKESESSSDLSEKSSQKSYKHGKHDSKGKHSKEEKHGSTKKYTPQELEKRLQEREQKHRRKQQWKKSYEKKRSQKDQREHQRERKHEAGSRTEDRSVYYRRHPKQSDLSLPTAPEPQHVQILSKMKVKSP